VTRSWIADTSEEIEHPPIPIGLNEMTVPRAMIILSFATVMMLIISSLWLVVGALAFQEDLEKLFPNEGATEADLKKEGRWAWEIDLLFDTCESRLGDWDWPESLADQDEYFLYPGELRCDWEHQGEGDRASVVVYNRGNTTIDLILEIIGGGVEFTNEGSSNLLLNGLEGNSTEIIEISLTEDIAEKDLTITATHVEFNPASMINLDVHLFKGTEERSVHITDGDNIEVHYILWDADTNQQLDEGDLPVTGGDDSRYIKGFGWAVIGLDIADDRGWITDTGTTHTVLLPPPIAYGNSEGHELENTWLRFEVKIDRALI
tara:strand:- start:70 stop:1026 length:957 start_codon:yes stop_codon:yes gene_type:complete